uniref:Retrovirus-related Pol polyprotein from transposon TNT 1-94 n=1 Tax=Tanacetum cinerariifolium TaxID=118510 RepID=A0A6L2J2X1_TANCI|nr:retrovirus-related Pol polyprotein from transposon TNT 1-94 [Tanacetum cinerariifolium]
MAIPKDHLAKFHKMTNAKEMWKVNKSRFGGNDESKKMQEYILKHIFEGFLYLTHKDYTKRTKPGVDTLSFDDLYNNLRVFESDVKGSTASSSSTQNVAFVSSDSPNSTNEVSTAYGVSTSFGHKSQKKGSLSYADDLMYSFFANQSSGPQLDHEDLKQVDEFDLEEMDLKWQVSMISTMLKKFYKKTGRELHFYAKEPVGFDKSKVERDAGNTGYKARDNGKRPAKQDEYKAMVTIDEEGVDWTGHAEDDTEDYALMAFNSSNLGSDTEMSAKDESGLRYESQIQEGVLSYENEVFERNYMPLKSNFGIDESKFTYGPKLSTTSESDANTIDLDSCKSSSSVETLDSVPKPVESKPTVVNKPKDHPHKTLQGKCIVDSECSRHMTGNKAYLVDYQDFNGGPIAFRGSKGQITVLLRVPKQNNMYSFNLENIVPSRGLACLIAKATVDESNKWHRRVLVTKPQNKTPYELLTGKFEGKSDEGFLVGHSLSSKAFRPITVDNTTNKTAGLKEANNIAGTQDSFDVGNSKMEAEYAQEHYEPVDLKDQAFLEEVEQLKRQEKEANDAAETLRKTFAQSIKDLLIQAGAARATSTNFVNAPSTPLNSASTLIKPKKISQALEDKSWVDAMPEVNKNDEKGVVVRNMVRLVTQVHRQEERIDYDEVFSHVARIEAIRIFLAFASYMGFIVYQMDVKSAFLYCKIDDEVYVSQPACFIDPKFPNKWIQKRTHRQVFIYKKDKKDIMPVQVYVDDIIFGSTKKSWCDEFEALMKSVFHMISIDELTFFFGLQVKQKEDGICISQDKYVAEILKKFDFLSVKIVSTPIKTKKPLVKDEEYANVDVHLYRSMIGSLMYLTASRPDIMRLISWQCKKQTIVATSTTELKVNATRPKLTAARVYVAEGTGFSREVTLLFDNMLVQAPKEVAEQSLPLPSNDPLPGGEDSLKLKELMDLCTNLSNKVLDLESEVIDIKTTYQERIEKLKGSVERLKEENRVLRELKNVQSIDDADEPIMEEEKSSKQGRKIVDIDADVEINLEKAQDEAYNLDLDHQEKVISMLDDKEPAEVEEMLKVVKVVKLMTEVVNTTRATKVSVPRRRNGVIIQDPEETTTTTTVQLKVQAKDKGKAILIEEPKSLKRQALIELDEEVAKKLEAEKPVTQDQARRNMILYLKNMAGFKMDYFKGMTYDEIRPIFQKYYKFNQAFLEEVNEGVKVPETKEREKKDVEVKSSKREGEGLDQESEKKQKMKEDTKELKKHFYNPLTSYKDPFKGIYNDDNQDDDDEQTNSNNDGDDFVYPKFSTHNDEDKEEERFDPMGDELDDEGENEVDDGNEQYRDVNINLEGLDIQMADAQKNNVLTTQETEDTHVIITSVNPEGQQQNVTVTTTAEPPLLSATTLPLLSTHIITHLQQTPVTSPANVPSSSLQDLPNFGSLFGESKTSHAIAANLSELELKKILIDKMERNKSIHKSAKQKNLHKALVKAYESNKLILDTYGDSVTIKRRRDDQDEDEEPSAGSNRGSKRRRVGKEPESTSAPKEKTSMSIKKSTKGSKSHHKSASKSALAEEPMHIAKDLEEPTHQEFITGFTEDQPIEDTSYHPDWESARDVYSKRIIIAITELQVVEWHNYKHLDWITVCRDDDKLYKFKEGDFNRLRIQDIEDLLLLLVQGKLTNLTVEERLAFNVSLRMLTRSIIIQKNVEDL